MSSRSCGSTIVLSLLPIVLLAACAPRPAFRPGGDFSAQEEKSLFVALRDVHASDDQRLAVMAAYDETQPKLRALSDEGRELLGQWHSLDRRDPAFSGKAAMLAERWGRLARERMALTAQFEGRVAKSLDAAQWEQWQQFRAAPAFGSGEGPPGGDEGHPRRSG